MILRFIFFILLFAGLQQDKGLLAQAINNNSKVVQVSGYLLDSKSLNPIMFSTIGIKNTPWGTMSLEKGFFSIPAKLGDTLMFASIGYKLGSLVVPDTITDHSYSYIQYLDADTIQLPEVVLYPWPTEEALRQAFLDLKLPTEQEEIAGRNLDPRLMAYIASETGMDGGEMFSYQMNQLQEAYYTKGQFKRMRLFEPSAWMDFINAWKRGDFAKQ